VVIPLILKGREGRKEGTGPEERRGNGGEGKLVMEGKES